ncbi:unnamed protein product [Hermetia illucens]|uniref:Phospholipase A2 n=1 Tax=Hermetia illucens TaxID=343691 RepID=A0A7R8UY21_HERIL|nr:phospholipase A2-like isoform X2 [Hermetia illucens]CAD7089097.1 unnamed protein product [Hermetia illucens]
MSSQDWWLILLVLTLNSFCQGNQVLDVTHDVSTSDVKEVDRASLTVPGTKWCGPGNTASGPNDLGVYMETDKCCRAHDNCDNIPSGESKHGLTNNDPFTVLHCDCDKAFYDCLMASKDKVAPVIGENYFLLRSRCYREDYPIKECQEYEKLLIFRRCVKYEVDNSGSKQYQWFNLPFYSDKPFPNYTSRRRFAGDMNTIDDSPANED